ncbi:kinase domain protein (macronuclear) [Tetrahymena thermophila SB210]|uniref:Kinase domain protein n=1 Tax=Tetrahymena thermophila (strain SB210) TaxID=312017 RepID=Q23E89_TETTS|nr:kinase domain protein [Tetrahymena thermophila SB210]EAR94864.2 kinase domain protein [Tetrahymena thermophila SB210]|eukprot:XP_001015109.2 kinase domain protein [Tetrahymena thermophila SB210]
MGSQLEKPSQKYPQLNDQQKINLSQQNKDNPDKSNSKTPSQYNSINDEKEKYKKEFLIQNNFLDSRYEKDQILKGNQSQISQIIPIARDHKKLQQSLNPRQTQIFQNLLLKLKENYYSDSFQFIGAGSFSMVYSAKKIKNNQNIALRIQEVHDQDQDDFNNYISICKQIQMPLIAELYDVYYIDIEKSKFAIFELELAQCDLNQLLKGQEQNGQLNEEDKMIIAKQLIEVINYVHNFNIILRDIKPSKIGLKLSDSNQISIKLFISYWTIRLKDGSNAIKTKQPVGALVFSAPENNKENQDDFVYSKESDIFSLGATLCVLDNYEILKNKLRQLVLSSLEPHFKQPFEKLQINRQSQIYKFIEQFCKYEIKQRKPLQSIIDQNQKELLSNKEQIQKDLQKKQLFLYNSGCKLLQSITQYGLEVELNYGQDCKEFFSLHEDEKSNGQVNILSNKEINDKIKRHCEIMNPHISKFEQEDISFTYDYFLYYKTVHQDSKKVELLEQQTQQIINTIYKKVNSLDLTKPIQQQKPEDQFNILKGVLFTYFRNAGHQVQLSNEQGSEEDLVSFYQSLTFLTGQLNNSQYYELTIPDTDELNYENITSDYTYLKQFIQKFITAASKAYQVPETSIQILNIKKGSVKLHYFIQQSVNISYDQILQQLQKIFQNLTIELKSNISNTVIKDSYFNSEFNFYWDKRHEKIKDYRGSLTKKNKKEDPKIYYFPLDYLGFAINVQKFIQDNSEWLSKGPKAWIVLYHGTDLKGYQCIPESYIKPGNRNAYGNYKCRLTGEFIKEGSQANTYLSDLATLGKYKATFKDTAENYCTPIEFCNKQYKLIFQCRVNPKYVKSPKDRVHYFTVEAQYAQENIRPYRILLKEHIQ